jgi:hypothetical protein
VRYDFELCGEGKVGMSGGWVRRCVRIKEIEADSVVW